MDTQSQTTVKGLNGAWSAYRSWAATARYHKAALDFSSLWALRLALIGAVIATTADQFAPFAPANGTLHYLARVPGVVAAGLIALGAYFSAQALSSERDQVWIRCRAAAESIKSLIILYRAGVPPFDSPNRAVELGQRVDKTLQEMRDVTVRPPEGGERPPVVHALTVDKYLEERVIDQIGWYRKRAGEFQALSDRYAMVVRVFGALGAALGVVTALSGASAWLAVIAAATTAVTAYVKNQRYQTLIGVYLATATRLELLKDQWLDSEKTEADKAERNAFIQRCEETMALENSAWVAQWKEQIAPPPAAAQPQNAEAKVEAKAEAEAEAEVEAEQTPNPDSNAAGQAAGS